MRILTCAFIAILIAFVIYHSVHNYIYHRTYNDNIGLEYNRVIKLSPNATILYINSAPSIAQCLTLMKPLETNTYLITKNKIWEIDDRRDYCIKYLVYETSYICMCDMRTVIEDVKYDSEAGYLLFEEKITKECVEILAEKDANICGIVFSSGYGLIVFLFLTRKEETIIAGVIFTFIMFFLTILVFLT